MGEFAGRNRKKLVGELEIAARESNLYPLRVILLAPSSSISTHKLHYYM